MVETITLIFRVGHSLIQTWDCHQIFSSLFQKGNTDLFSTLWLVNLWLCLCLWHHLPIKPLSKKNWFSYVVTFLSRLFCRSYSIPKIRYVMWKCHVILWKFVMKNLSWDFFYSKTPENTDLVLGLDLQENKWC